MNAATALIAELLAVGRISTVEAEVLRVEATPWRHHHVGAASVSEQRLEGPLLPNHQPAVIADLIDKWPSLGDFARDAGVSYGGAKQMRRRGSIAVGYWPALIASAKGREIKLSAETMVQLHAGSDPTHAPRLAPAEEAA